jgi:hypothetical protein
MAKKSGGVGGTNASVLRSVDRAHPLVNGKLPQPKGPRGKIQQPTSRSVGALTPNTDQDLRTAIPGGPSIYTGSRTSGQGSNRQGTPVMVSKGGTADHRKDLAALGHKSVGR